MGKFVYAVLFVRRGQWEYVRFHDGGRFCSSWEEAQERAYNTKVTDNLFDDQVRIATYELTGSDTLRALR